MIRSTARFLPVLLLAALLSPMLLTADELAWTGYSEALQLAKESGKKVLVDVYTDWCGWCKRMDKDVYANEKVKAFLKEHFETAKLNAEAVTKHTVDGYTLTEKEIAALYQIKGYPATIFLTPEGKTITIVPGYVSADRFLPMLEYIEGEHYKTTKWEDYLSAREK